MTTNLFIITSPLQLINAIEAREYFQTKNNKLVAIFTEFESKNKDQIIKLINENEWDDVLYFDMRPTGTKTTFFRQIKLAKQLQKEIYNNVFCGDLSSSIKLIVSNVQKNKVYLLDDGATTINRHLNELSGNTKKKNPPKKILRQLRFNIFGLKTALNDTINMFTSYKLEPHADEKIIHNNLTYFKNIFLADTTLDKQVYFLGQPLSELNIVNRETYLSYINTIRHHYSNQNIIYIPHRFEKNIEEIEKLQNANFTVKHIDLPVELEFINCKTYPMQLCSFFSSALFTLNILYPEASITAFEVEQKDALIDTINIDNVYNYIEKNTTIKKVSL
jgi:hypothetical protein